jgi:hypothetical protein
LLFWWAPADAREETAMDEESTTGLDRSAVKWAVKEALDELLGLRGVRMAPRFEGGTLVIRPGKTESQEKVIPIDTFFHKITMVRDRLRVLEQRINSHPRLNEMDRSDLQQYITRAYGSLTTFNILFRDRGEGFIGAREAPTGAPED